MQNNHLSKVLGSIQEFIKIDIIYVWISSPEPSLSYNIMKYRSSPGFPHVFFPISSVYNLQAQIYLYLGIHQSIEGPNMEEGGQEALI